jgi:hypothetical protein
MNGAMSGAFSGVLLKGQKELPPDTWSGMRVNSIIIKSFGD